MAIGAVFEEFDEFEPPKKPGEPKPSKEITLQFHIENTRLFREYRGKAQLDEMHAYIRSHSRKYIYEYRDNVSPMMKLSKENHVTQWGMFVYAYCMIWAIAGALFPDFDDAKLGTEAGGSWPAQFVKRVGDAERLKPLCATLPPSDFLDHYMPGMRTGFLLWHYEKARHLPS